MGLVKKVREENDRRFLIKIIVIIKQLNVKTFIGSSKVVCL